MAKLPTDQRLEVEKLIEDKEIVGDLRPYLGLSSIADECSRKLWYGFRLCANEVITPRQKRLFSRGHNEEPIIIEDLVAIGIRVHSDQAQVIYGHGHIKGHCDGMADNVPDAPKTTHLLEFKTANDKNFAKFKKDGLEKTNPVYYGQIICYMYLLKLKRTLYVIVNKNTDERLYFRIEENTAKAKEILERGVDIISSEVPPPKPSGFTASWFQCKWCKFYDICHYDGAIDKTCRSCESADVCEDGKWECSKLDIELSFDQQLLACKKYSLLPCLRK